MILVVVLNIVRNNSTVSELQVRVRYNHCDTLVRDITLHHTIDTAMPTLLSEKVKNVDTRRIKNIVMRSPYVEHCQAHVSILGKVVVRVDQRRPLLHVYHRGRQFYIDSRGRYMPLSPDGKAHVMIASGHLTDHDTLITPRLDLSQWAVDTLLCNNTLTQVWQLSSYLDANNYLALFDQIYTSPRGDLILTPRAGTHVVNVGRADQLDDKFERLLALYDQALPRVGWDRYRTINLKYNGQVVCQRR